MSPIYATILALHVLFAVLGLGSIASVAVLAATARRTGRAAAEAAVWLGPLLRYFALSLGVMLLTGILLDLAARGAFHGAWWLRGSVLLLVATGAVHAWTRRGLRQGPAGKSREGAMLQRVVYGACTMCVLIGAITVLMEVKPF